MPIIKTYLFQALPISLGINTSYLAAYLILGIGFFGTMETTSLRMAAHPKINPASRLTLNLLHAKMPFLTLKRNPAIFPHV